MYQQPKARNLNLFRRFVKLVMVLSLHAGLLGIQSCDQSQTDDSSVLSDDSSVLGNESASDSIKIPNGVKFNIESIYRPDKDSAGDNWCLTWTSDGDQMTSMSDGAWIPEGRIFHNMAYQIQGEADDFTRSKVSGYPEFIFGDEDSRIANEPGWYGYGIVAIEETIYSMVSKVPSVTFDGPFRGVKMLKSTDNGDSWYRVNRIGETRLIAPTDEVARNSTAVDDMFFLEEHGSDVNGKIYYPFSYVAFVQNGQAGRASQDGYIYIYSPEGAKAHQLLLARARKDEFEVRDNWEYFKQWQGDTPVWSKDITERGSVMEFPKENSNGETFGWYSWLPSVVWNEGLGVYIMVNGGSYTFNYNWNALDLSGSLGLWYSLTPYGPWKQIYYTDHFIADDPRNRIYQPKLSPKWISEDGEEMVLIWSDAMANELGESHTVNYRWNQMKINFSIDANQFPSASAGADQSIQATATQPGEVFLNGVMSDDGLPIGSSLKAQWSKLSGPGTVTFAAANQPQTSANFSLNGRYELQLSATDGELKRSDTVVIKIQ